MKIYHNEIDPQCCDVLRRHFPDSTVDERSIKDVRGEDLAGYDQCHFFAGIGGFSLAFQSVGTPAGITVWTGGFPCQDLSVAGNRAGLAGERSGLYFEFHRLLTERYPDVVVIENVPGLLSSNEGKDFAIVIGGLTGYVPEVPAEGWGSAGAFRGGIYTVVYRILDAQFFGLAQRRRRVFIVGHLGDGRAAEVLFESEGMSGNTPPSRKAGQRLADSLTVGANQYSGFPGEPVEDIAPTIPARTRGGGGLGTDFDLDGGLAGPALSLNAHPTGRYDPSEETLIVDSETFTIRSGIDGGGKGYLGSREQAMTLGGQEQWLAWETRFARNGRGGPDGVCPPLKAQNGRSGKGDGAPMVGVRRLTPTECERLQGFPDGWTEGQSDSARYRQLGNAVAVTVIEWIAKRLKMVEKCRQ